MLIKKTAVAKLNAEDAAREAARLTAKLKIEEAKLQERRAKQEQQLAFRAERRELKQEAKEGERLLEEACSELELLLKLRTSIKQDAAAAKVVLDRTEKRVQELALRLEDAERELAKAQIVSNTLEDLMDTSIVTTAQKKLTSALTECKEAWDQMPKATYKKEHDRSLKKRAKDLL